AGNQDGNLRRRDLADVVEHLPHGGARPDHLGVAWREVKILAFAQLLDARKAGGAEGAVEQEIAVRRNGDEVVDEAPQEEIGEVGVPAQLSGPNQYAAKRRSDRGQRFDSRNQGL